MSKKQPKLHLWTSSEFGACCLGCGILASPRNSYECSGERYPSILDNVNAEILRLEEQRLLVLKAMRETERISH